MSAISTRQGLGRERRLSRSTDDSLSSPAHRPRPSSPHKMASLTFGREYKLLHFARVAVLNVSSILIYFYILYLQYVTTHQGVYLYI